MTAPLQACHRHAALVGALLVVLAGWLSLADVAKADPLAEGAQKYVQAMLADGIKSLTPPDISDAERLRRFRGFVGRNVDMLTVAKAVLGRYWERASPAQQDRFAALFQDYLILSYVSALKDYTNETIKISDTTTQDPSLAVVHSQILEAGDAPTRLDIAVRQPAPGRYMVADLVVDGVSIIAAKRSEFSAVLRQSGGIDRLIEILQKKNAELAGQDK